MLSGFWLIQFCVLLGKDYSDGVLLIQMFSDSRCLPGLPSLTFQCSVTNNSHVQFDSEGHSRLPTVRGVGAALSYGVVSAYDHSRNYPPVCAVAVKELCFLCDSFLFFLFYSSRHLLFFKGLNFIIRNAPC